MSDSTVRQQTIAEALGVSRSTVTKVLNHDPVYRVSPDMRHLILKTAREMGYTLRRRKTGNIAYLQCGGMATGEEEFHRALCDVAHRLQYRVFLVNKPAFPMSDEVNLFVNPLCADGVVLTGQYSVDMAERLSEIMPLIAVGAGCPPHIDEIIPSADLMCRQLVDYLVDHGHRRIALIVHSLREGDGRAAQLARWQSILEEAGAAFDSTMIWEKERTLYSVLLKELVGHPAKPTAILTTTTADHSEIMNCLLLLGLRVPEDISYVGWSCPANSRALLYGRVTSLDGYYQAVAHTAVQRLMDRIENRSMAPAKTGVFVDILEGDTVARTRNP